MRLPRYFSATGPVTSTPGTAGARPRPLPIVQVMDTFTLATAGQPARGTPRR